MRSALRIAAAAAALAVAAACATARSSKGAGASVSAELGRIDVAFVRGTDDVLAAGPVSSALYREGEREPVLVSEETAWTADDLAPGRYVVELRSWYDSGSGFHDASETRTVEIGPGEHRVLRITLWDARDAAEALRRATLKWLEWFARGGVPARVKP